MKKDYSEHHQHIRHSNKIQRLRLDSIRKTVYNKNVRKFRYSKDDI